MYTPELRRLFEQCPLPRENERRKLEEGDIEYGARRYAKLAASLGTEGPAWRIWLELQLHREMSLEQALHELGPEQSRWLGLWGLTQGKPEIGSLSYRRYLERPGSIGPFSNENCIYLDYLLASGRDQEVLDSVELLTAINVEIPLEQMRAAQVELKNNQVSRALERMRPYFERYRDDPVIAEFQNLLLTAAGQPLVEDIPFRDPICSATTFILEPSTTDGPHRFGGEPDYQMPACPGCGHPLHQWFSLELADILDLAHLLPSWQRFPLVGCVDCDAWKWRQDYQVLGHQLVVISPTCKVPDPHGSLGPLPPQSARLKASSLQPNWNQPLVGGEIPWVQSPESTFCWKCKSPTVYVAAMAWPRSFDERVFINNGSGYQYHFACDACHTVSVLAQWT